MPRADSDLPPLRAPSDPWTWRSIVLPIVFSAIAIVITVGIIVIAALVAPAFDHRPPEMPPMQLGEG